jgi:hypothetical protein
MFKAMRNARAAPEEPSYDPVDVLEEFCKHAGLMLDACSSPHGKLWAEAFRHIEVQPD